MVIRQRRFGAGQLLEKRRRVAQLLSDRQPPDLPTLVHQGVGMAELVVQAFAGERHERREEQL